MRPLILSGGPAVGKTTSGRRLAEASARAAFIDADDIRQLVVAGQETLWSGPAGTAQHVLAARNVAAMARNLGSAGFDVVIADVVTAEALAVYRSDLPGCLVVQLRIGLDGARRRAATRRVFLTDEEFALLHRLMAEPPDVDLVLAVDGLDVDTQVRAIRDAWDAASGA